MSSVQALREFINERLTAAAGEIFTVFQQTIVQYEEEIDRQRKLLQISSKPQIKFHRTESPQQHVGDQKTSSSLEQEEHEAPHVKEEEDVVEVTVTDGESDNSLDSVRDLTTQRLTAAAGEIFTLFEPTIVQYEEKIDRQRKLLQISSKPQIKFHRTESPQQHVGNQKTSSSLEQEEHEAPHIKEEEDVVEVTVTDGESENSLDSVRDLTTQRLTAAAGEIFTLFEPTVLQYEEEIDRQHRLLEIIRKPQIKLHRTEFPQQHVCQEEQLRDQELLQEEEDLKEPMFPEMKQDREERTLKQEAGSSGETLPDDKHHLSPAEPDGERLQSVDEGSTREVELRRSGEDVDDHPVSVNLRDSHMSQEHSEYREHGTGLLHDPRVQENPGNSSGKKLYPCGTCGKTFAFLSLLKRHVTRHTGEKLFSCETCGKRFSQQSNMMVHAKIHKDETPCACQTCGKSFRGKNKLMVHLGIHTDERPYHCNTCGKGFAHLSALKAHAVIHTGEKPYSCETCGKSFNHQSNLSVHVRTHTGEKPHHCNTCGKRFNYLSSLQRHMTTHTDEKPYSCDACSRSFSRQSNLLVHMRIHTGEKPYSCKTCGACFRQRSTLLRHVQTHSAVKRFSCETCGKGFSQQSNLSYHMRSHSVEKPYSCHTCGASFAYRNTLLRHAGTHTGLKLFSCETCGKSFSRKDKLLVHARTHTGDVLQT